MIHNFSRAFGALVVALALAPLQSALAIQSPPDMSLATTDGHCACLNWKDMYNTGSATCSPGMIPGMNQPAEPHLDHREEVLVRVSPALRQATGDVESDADAASADAEMCDRFLARIDDNVCLNVNLGQPGLEAPGQWCFVSPGCQNGVRANSTRDMLVKRCSTEQDTMLRDKSPEDLFGFALQKGVSPAISVRTAYPVEKGLLPLHVRAFFGLEPNMRVAAPRPAVLARIKELRDGNSPVVLDSPDSSAPFALVQGQKTFLIEHDDPAGHSGSDVHPQVAAQALWSKHFTLNKIS